MSIIYLPIYAHFLWIVHSSLAHRTMLIDTDMKQHKKKRKAIDRHIATTTTIATITIIITNPDHMIAKKVTSTASSTTSTKSAKPHGRASCHSSRPTTPQMSS